MEKGRREGGRKWEEMDEDCLTLIFSKCRLHELLVSVPFVCKQWHRAYRNPLCWKVIDFIQIYPEYRHEDRNMFDHYDCEIFSAILRRTVSLSQGSVVSISLPNCASIEDLDFISLECPNLQFIAFMSPLSDYDDIIEHIPKVIGRWKGLRSLSIDFTRFGRYRERLQKAFLEIMVEVGKHCKNFTNLKLSRLRIGQAEANAIVAAAPKLECLFCDITGPIKREVLLQILQGCRNLTWLSLDSSHLLNDEEVIAFHQMLRLKNVTD